MKGQHTSYPSQLFNLHTLSLTWVSMEGCGMLEPHKIFVDSHLENISSQGYVLTEICIRKTLTLNNFTVVLSIDTSMVQKLSSVYVCDIIDA